MKIENGMIRLSFITVIAAAFLVLAGCGSNNSESVEIVKPAVAYMIANTANAVPLTASATPMVQDTMIECARNYGYSFIVRVDGEPELVSAEDLDIDAKFKNASKERLDRDARSKASNLLAVLDEVSAVYPEVDYLEGLRCAAASLRSLDDSYTSRTIICCGTGFGTTGYVDFNNNLLSADPLSIAEMLKEREALPDLTDITVYWVGMGQVAAPQAKLTPKQVNHLQSIWQQIIETSGGEFIPNDYISVVAEMETANQTLPSVSVVELPPDKPIIFESEALAPDEEDNQAFSEPVMLTESLLEFVEDKSTYRYPETALSILQPVAEYLNQHASINLLLVGSTAGDETNESTLRLSLERAAAVQQTLTELGVDADRLTAVGMAADSPYHIHGAGFDGPLACANRHVLLIEASTDLAKEIMDNYY